MRKKSTVIVAVLCALTAGACFTACSGNNSGDGGHRVTFIYNYADAPAAQSVTVGDGETVSKPTDPTREDYRFNGWYTATVCSEKYAYDFNDPVTQNIRLFANWQLSNATVTFDLNYDGGKNTTDSVEVGEKVSRPETDPVREDYRFDGWYADSMGTREFDFNTAINDNTVVYAKWTQTVATITFVQYDDVVTTAKVDINKAATRPAQSPAREDYEFLNWYSDRACTTVYDFSAPVTANTRIYAGWKLLRATVTFDYNYDVEDGKAKVDVGSAVAQPEDPERENFDFGGWYMDAACTMEYNFASNVNDNITIYAKWERSDVTVKFDPNYGEQVATSQKVKYNSIMEEPSEPSRDGYVFTGWYTDKECTVWFNFGAPVTDNATVYAGWVEKSDKQVNITYNLNYGANATLKETKVKIGNKIKSSAPKDDTMHRNGYYFAGWCRDAACTMPVNVDSARASMDMTLYAKWMKGYAFEAEYTYLDGKPGQGTSDNVTGKQLIQYVKDVRENGNKMGMSNGAYVGKLYYNGAFLEFKINSDKEVLDAVLVLRLTPDLYDMIFTDDEWQVIVNDEQIKYGNLALTGAIAQNDHDANGDPISGDMNKRPFENYTITTALHLKAGVNIIRLETHNNLDHGGTFNAHTPLIDVMYIYSDSTLTWAECHPENLDKSQPNVKADVDYVIEYEGAGTEPVAETQPAAKANAVAVAKRRDDDEY